MIHFKIYQQEPSLEEAQASARLAQNVVDILGKYFKVHLRATPSSEVQHSFEQKAPMYYAYARFTIQEVPEGESVGIFKVEQP